MKQNVPKKLGALADLIGARLQGDAECLIHRIASLDSAKEGEISFLGNKQYRKFLPNTRASAVIVSAEDAKICPVNALVTENPRLSLAKVAKLFEKILSIPKGIHPTAVIGEGCQIASSASIGAYVVLGKQVVIGEDAIVNPGCAIGDESSLGKNTVLKSRVVLYDNVCIGDNCLIHSGAVIGSDGFGFATQNDNWIKMPHLGGVTIGNQVEIGANTTIDRGFLEDTTISDNVIIDNLVQIGHNVSIGEGTAIAGCVGIAGSASIGKYCQIGGGSSIAGHIQLADKVYITATSGVNHSLSAGIYSSGFPAKPAHLWRKNVARFNFLEGMARRLRALEKYLQLNTRLTEDE